MFENTNDTYYWFCNNSDMYASDLKTNLYEFYIVLKYQEVLWSNIKFSVRMAPHYS